MSESRKHFLRDLSIRNKLMLITMGISITVLFVISTVQFSYGVQEKRLALVQEMSLIAELIGNRSSAALQFLDSDGAKKNLAAASVADNIVFTCIYDGFGDEFAHYYHKKTSTTVTGDGQKCPPVSESNHAFLNNKLTLFDSIVVNGEAIGTIYLESDLIEIRHYIQRQILYTLGFMVVGVLLAWLLSARLQRIISGPISKLLTITAHVSESDDYSLRAEKSGNDELGTLVDAYNQMLARIQTREQELVQSKEKAEEASYAKSRFLATMSHELRTPLNGVVGMADLMMGTELNDKQKKYATTLNNSAEVLLTIISDILDFSKIESGDLEINPVPIDLYQHVKEVVSLMTVRAEEGNIEFILDVPHHIRRGFELDPVRIKQMILNMAGNAIKFSENGYVAIRVYDVKSENNKTVLRFEVEDNGIGIPEDKQESIFEHFTQADVSTTREYGGTGLGLAICKKLTALMNGTIGVHSRVGEGSTFWFEIPTRNCDLPEEGTIASLPSLPERTREQRILIVDDFVPNLDVLQAYLKSWDMESVCVTSGEKALRELKRAHLDGTPYTLTV